MNKPNSVDSNPLIDCPICRGDSFSELFTKHNQRFVRCLGCSLMLINPRPAAQEIAAGYDASYSAGYVKKAAKKLIRARRRVRRLQRRYGLSGRWLDVGCSAGFVVAAARDAGFEAYGCDIELMGLEYGRTELQLTRLGAGLVQEQAYPDNYFQAISAYDVIEHVTDLNEFVAELKRIVHPQGVIDIGTPDLGHWRVPKNLSLWNEVKPGEHLYYFDRQTLTRLLERHGLSVVHRRLALKPGLKLTARKSDG